MSNIANLFKPPTGAKWQSGDKSADFLQILDIGGNALAWIDGNGVLQGSFTAPASVNGALIVGPGFVQYQSLQAAHDALPSTGGTIFVMATGTPFGVAGTTAFVITKPVHVVFDSGTFTYSGSAVAAISGSGVHGVIIEGSGRAGDDTAPPSVGTSIIITNTATNGILVSACAGITVRGFNLVGPGSGTGKGVVNSSTRSKWDELNINSWGSDGWQTDGTATNANEGYIGKVRSSLNGGNGFTLQGVNQQGYLLVGADAAFNTGDNFSVSNSINVFQGTNSSPNSGKICYHFLSGATGNVGNVFADAPNPTITFDAGTLDNFITSIGSSIIVVNNGGRNFVLQPNINHDGNAGWTLFNKADTTNVLRLDSGASVVQRNILLFSSLGIDRWRIETDNSASPVFYIRDVPSASALRLVFNPGGTSELNSVGVSAVQINTRNGLGTGGVNFGNGLGASVAVINGSGVLSLYKGITTAQAGVPVIVPGPAKLTAQAAAVSGALAFATGVTPGAGLYRLTYVATITTVDATSCTLGGAAGFQITFTNANGDSVVKTSNPTTPNVSSVNATGTTVSGVIVGYAAASSNINYSFGYTAAGGQMRYDLAVYVEYLG